MKRNSHIRRKYRLVILSVLVSVLATHITPVASGKEEPGISNSEIKLGASYPLSGYPISFFNDFYIGANAYFEYLNSNGGVYGRKIKVIYLNDQGNAQLAVNAANTLILKDKVFALFNSAPTTAAHIASIKYAGIAGRGVPDLAVTGSYSDFSDLKKFPTTFVIAPNARQEARILLHFIKNSFSGTPFNLTYTNNDLEVDLLPAWQSSGVMFGSVQTYIDGGFGGGVGFRTDLAGVLNFSNQSGLFSSCCTVQTASNAYPLIVRGASLNGVVVGSNQSNIHANFYLPLVSDVSDPYISFFNDLLAKQASGKTISQHMIEGANAAYIVAQAIAGIGDKPTRAKLLAFMKTNSKTLSTAAFSPLDYSDGANAGSFVQYVAKYDGNKWTRVSDYFQVDSRGTAITPVSIQRLPLLPSGLPVMKMDSSSVEKSITCVKGKITKKVKAVKPKCPKGYKKK